MTINHVYTQIVNIMQLLEDINFLSPDKHIKLKNQKLICNAYSELDGFKDELIREHIKNKQKAGK